MRDKLGEREELGVRMRQKQIEEAKQMLACGAEADADPGKRKWPPFARSASANENAKKHGMSLD